MSLFDGPDGNMYVVDMYRGVVQAGGLWSEYLTDYIKSHEMELPVGRGRIWRVVYGNGSGAARPRAGAVEGDAAATGADAVESEGLVARHGAAAARRARRHDRRAGAQDAGGSAPDWRTRLHALWTLDGLDAIERRLGRRRRWRTPTPTSVRAGVRLSERWLATGRGARGAR